MDLPKRDRSSNFTEDESMLLVQLVVKYINIIENKHADAATWKHKELTWDCITKEFQRETVNKSAVREVKNLRIKYESMKKIIRKKIADGSKLKDYEQELFRHLVAENDFGLTGQSPDIKTIKHNNTAATPTSNLSFKKFKSADPLEDNDSGANLVDVQIKTETADMDLEEEYDFDQEPDADFDSSNGTLDSIQNACLQQMRKSESTSGHSKNLCCENLRADLRKFIDTSKVFMEIEMVSMK